MFLAEKPLNQGPCPGFRFLRRVSLFFYDFLFFTVFSYKFYRYLLAKGPFTLVYPARCREKGCKSTGTLCNELNFKFIIIIIHDNKQNRARFTLVKFKFYRYLFVKVKFRVYFFKYRVFHQFSGVLPNFGRFQGYFLKIVKFRVLQG